MKMKQKFSKGFYIYGRNVVEEAILNSAEYLREVFIVKDKGNKELQELAELARSRDIRVINIDEKKAKQMFGEVQIQGIGAYHTIFHYNSFQDVVDELDENKNRSILILDGVEDVANFGAIIRSAAATGISAICIPSHNNAPINGITFKTSAGTVHKVKIIQFSGINQMISDAKKYGFWIYGIDANNEKVDKYAASSIWEQEFDKKSAFVIGSEGQEKSQKAKENCDFVVPIPMENNVESLNVSVATAVVLYEWKRQMMK